MKLLASAALAAMVSFAAIETAAAQAPAPAAPAAAKFSVDSLVGDLLGNPAAKAVLQKYIPEVVADPNLQMGVGFPLSGIAQFVPQLTPEMLAKIDADLKKL